ncbi:MAG: DsrE family protein [Halomonas subglaciescola]|nr:DsrE family protein [Halomonas subglaciescola]
MANTAQRVLILVVSGPNTPARCAAPFHIATLLACLDADVTLYLTGEATDLALPGVAEALYAEPGGVPVIHFMRQAKQAGVELCLCRKPPAPKQPPIALDALIEEVSDYGSGGELAAMILEYDKVLSL